MVRISLVAILGCLLLPSKASASSPITLTYAVRSLGDGTYRYVFTLTLDNHDGSWSPGQGFGWVVLGDGGDYASPLWDFQGDPATLPTGPWSRFGYTEGGSNGPSLGAEREMWYPNYVGDSVTWAGLSGIELEDGQLKWSSLGWQARDGAIVCEVAMRVLKCSPADINRDAFISGDDVDLFSGYFQVGDLNADIDGNGIVDANDFDLFAVLFAAGC